MGDPCDFDFVQPSFIQLSLAFGKSFGQAGYDPAVDVNRDGHEILMGAPNYGSGGSLWFMRTDAAADIESRSVFGDGLRADFSLGTGALGAAVAYVSSTLAITVEEFSP